MLVFRLREKLQSNFPLSLLYDAPTISGMANAIERLTNAQVLQEVSQHKNDAATSNNKETVVEAAPSLILAPISFWTRAFLPSSPFRLVCR